MIPCKEFLSTLQQNGVEYFFGVPDSLLKSFCAYVTDNVQKDRHIITANEGAAIGLAAGVYLSTKKPALVYMQNSGQGNAVNPLISLADNKVYSIPMLLLVGWRGEPGTKDEPQHIKQGEITLKLFDTLDIPYKILSADWDDDSRQIINQICKTINDTNSPYALIVRKETFEPYKIQSIQPDCDELLSRENAIEIVIQTIQEFVSNAVLVSTTGMISRELYEIRIKNKEGGASDFLTVGSMGHASAIALGIAKNCLERLVICLDGDGAALMHMGTLATIGTEGTENFKHIILNNGAHDSVGGQPTCGLKINFCAIASACGYKKTWKVESQQMLQFAVREMMQTKGPSFIEIHVKKGARHDLGRPKFTPIENKQNLMQFLQIY
ncbi:MAG: phosphonopyruvate decarboxylase [Planctomycetaceae bacterium]|jgi:phosphonopyruvate decarboxylase|nr:phosphonopyruvate decarboxylase [Planctomycetaceae bacterium]